jgi:hypothetical protein
MSSDRSFLSLARLLASAGFITASMTLIVATAGLRLGLEALSQHYAKKPIDIRKPLGQFDISCLPSFSAGWVSSAIPPEDIETDEYAIIRLTNTRPRGVPEEAVLFVTYYSDPKSKVPHTPDVCYRQAGALLIDMKDITIDLPESAPRPQIKARLLRMRKEQCDQVIIFCFYVDGQFKNSREQVRWMIGKPGNRYVYFAKIETASNYPTNGDPRAAIERCKRLFSEAVPILISEHFPTREQLRP